MKILQVGKYYFPALGGIETVVRTLAEGLAQEGHEVSVLCYDELVKQTVEETLNGVRIIRTPVWKTIFSQPISPNYFKRLWQEAKRHDVLHFHIPNPLAEFVALFFSLFSFKRKSFVATFHAEIQKQKLLKPFYSAFLKLFLSRTQKIITATQKQKTSSPSLVRFGEKCVVIPFSLPPQKSGEETDSVSFKTEIHKKYGNFCLFVGRLVSYKGVRFLVEAMKIIEHKLPGLNLVIVGDGPEWELLHHLVESHGLKERVFFTGKVTSDRELTAYYEACQFLVLPSVTHAEAFGLVLLEAMRLKKPLLTTRLESGVSEVNLHQITGLQVEPRDSSALAVALLELGQNPDLRKRMGDAGYLRMSTEFSFEKMVHSHLAIYRALLDRS